ncbi:MAG: endonuclease domain-containing protein [Mycobacteriales bacterium]
MSVAVAVAPAPWSLSGAAVLEPWKLRVRGELPLEPRWSGGPTPSEQRLWAQLEAWDIGWCREYATGPYRLDFYLPTCQLAVEVDGSSHDGPVRKRQDQARDAWHLARGIRTQRVTAAEVMTDVHGVLQIIASRMAEPLPSATDVSWAAASTSPSGETPVVPAAVTAMDLPTASEVADKEIEAFARVACVTILPVLAPGGRWRSLISRR